MRIKDIDQRTINYVTFYNEFFKRGRKDLLSSIQRSTNRGKSQTNHIETLEAKLSQLSEEVHRAQLQLAGMESLKQRIITIELKLGQSQLELKPNLYAEKETAAEYLHTSNRDTHSLPTAIKSNDGASSACMQNSVRHQSVGLCDNLDPTAKASDYLNELPNTNLGEGYSALRLLSEISQHPIANKTSPENIRHTADSLVYDQSCGKINLGQNIDGYENSTGHTAVRISDGTSLEALQRGISKFWETLTREENRV